MTARLIKKERPLPDAGYVTVTPDMASEWLETTAKNRRLNDRVVRKYAAAMKRGDWLVTSQGVAFDERGQLTDGQHRLSAIIMADTPVVLLVVRETSGKSQMVLDMGYKRTPEDQLALRTGWDVKAIHIAIARQMIIGVGGVALAQRREITKDIQLLERYYTRHHKAIEFIVDLMWRHKESIRGVSVAPVMAPLVRASYTQDRERVLRFGEVVTTGMADRPGDSPAVILRNWLIARDGISSRVHTERYVIYRKTEIALNAFIKGESIERLGIRNLEVELFPIPGDIVVKEGKAGQEDE